jgi:hypothetical protein
MGAAMKQNEHVAVPSVMRKLHHASRPQTRYRARDLDSDRHPFKAGRDAVRVRAKNGYLLASNSSADGSCSLPSGQSSARASEIISFLDVGRLFPLLSDICAQVLTRASALTAEYFRQLLDPVLPAGGIEIKGLGRRLIEDAHAEQDTIHALEKIHSPFIAPSAPPHEIGCRALAAARTGSHTPLLFGLGAMIEWL